jgi:predicted DNA-binding transcriptional regulator YafY
MDQLRVRTTPVTAQELAGLTEVSIRSIYRDIADLQAMGAPIRGEGGIGYVMDRGYFLPSLGFDPEELDALALGLRLVSERSSRRLAAAATRAAAKLSSAIGEHAREELLGAPLEAGPSAAGAQARAGSIHDDLMDAIHRRHLLEIDYTGLSGKRSSRLARPLGLTAFDETWLLTIWCETALDFRHLRIDRIERWEATGQSFRHERGKRFSDAVQKERAKLTSHQGQGDARLSEPFGPSQGRPRRPRNHRASRPSQ